MKKEYTIKLSCGHYAPESKVEAEGHLAVWCPTCQKTVDAGDCGTGYDYHPILCRERAKK